MNAGYPWDAVVENPETKKHTSWIKGMERDEGMEGRIRTAEKIKDGYKSN